MEFTGKTSLREVLERCPSARRIFDEHGLRGCGGEKGPAEALEFFANVHEADLDLLLRELNEELRHPRTYEFKEGIADFIYRRFFKAGVVVVLSIGALWGAWSLLQAALGHKLVPANLLPAIHAHAHAMIFGWMGLFVMGFAYQSFPRFKNTTLWRPGLANATFYMMLAGIVARVAAEMIGQGAVALALGGTSAAMEIGAIGIFVTVLVKTARKSVEPPVRYEKFIFAAYFWFFAQAVVDAIFFFANVTAANPQELARRIALIDPPLRDMQLLGFAALIIAGVSQRFVPLVFGLGRPKRDRQNLIFVLINGALVLDLVCYLGFRLTGGKPFLIGVEAAFATTFLWAALLVKQLGVFSKPTQPDRTFKFVRAAFMWLLVATAMLALYLPYGLWTGQGFAHNFLAAHHHAYTVGFVSLMIVGVAARVVPILAGMDSTKLSTLWGVFLLLNFGAAARVLLQLAADWWPRVAFPLVGFTGFLEVAALAWWGVELWRVVSKSVTERPKMFLPARPQGPQLVTIGK